MGGALAPYIAIKVAEHAGRDVPYYVGAACCVVAIAILVTRRRHLQSLDRVAIDHTFQDGPLPARA
ncbi:hypothetical protein [Spirillospora sp. CA-294931]|uniref:hypothetical protein n=1 Tax=Spirillospora sp. CA-294931 TaxID=3240042 RepID=UPI003D9340DC